MFLRKTNQKKALDDDTQVGPDYIAHSDHNSDSDGYEDEYCFNIYGFTRNGIDKHGDYHPDEDNPSEYSDNEYSDSEYSSYKEEYCFDAKGIDKYGYNTHGYNIDGHHYNEQKKYRFNADGRDIDTFDPDGYNIHGYDVNGRHHIEQKDVYCFNADGHKLNSSDDDFSGDDFSDVDFSDAKYSSIKDSKDHDDECDSDKPIHSDEQANHIGNDTPEKLPSRFKAERIQRIPDKFEPETPTNHQSLVQQVIELSALFRSLKTPSQRPEKEQVSTADLGQQSRHLLSNKRETSVEKLSKLQKYLYTKDQTATKQHYRNNRLSDQGKKGRKKDKNNTHKPALTFLFDQFSIPPQPGVLGQKAKKINTSSKKRR